MTVEADLHLLECRMWSNMACYFTGLQRTQRSRRKFLQSSSTGSLGTFTKSGINSETLNYNWGDYLFSIFLLSDQFVKSFNPTCLNLYWYFEDKLHSDHGGRVCRESVWSLMKRNILIGSLSDPILQHRPLLRRYSVDLLLFWNILQKKTVFSRMETSFYFCLGDNFRSASRKVA